MLDADRQEELKRRSSPAADRSLGDRRERALTYGSVAFPRSRSVTDDRGATYISPLSGFGQFLARRGTFPLLRDRLKVDERQRIIVGILEALRRYGLVEQVATRRRRRRRLPDPRGASPLDRRRRHRDRPRPDPRPARARRGPPYQ